jgi:N-acetylneuraminic acid mutarotase
MINPREACTTLYHNHYVYVLGGKNLKFCERFAVASKTWHSISSMYNARSDACAAVNGHFIFVVGGLPINTAGVTIERYNIQTDGWTLLSVNLPKGLFRHTVFLAS